MWEWRRCGAVGGMACVPGDGNWTGGQIAAECREQLVLPGSLCNAVERRTEHGVCVGERFFDDYWGGGRRCGECCVYVKTL